MEAKEAFLTRVEEEYEKNLEKVNTWGSWPDRSVIALESTFKKVSNRKIVNPRFPTSESLLPSYLRCVKCVEEIHFLNIIKNKDFFLGMAYDYNDFNTLYPNHCREYSGKDCMEIKDGCWNTIEDIKDWDPENGDIQILETDDSLEDEVIVAVKVDRESYLYSSLEEVNDKTKVFN